jgi:PAS domain S-box-containing protein
VARRTEENQIVSPPRALAPPRLRLAMARSGRPAAARALDVDGRRGHVARAVAHLADECLNPREAAAEPADALDRLRRQLNAAAAALWLCADGRARCVIRAGPDGRDPAAQVDLDQAEIAVERLQCAGTLLRRAGDVSGVERLAPDGVQSFAAAASRARGGGGRTCVLVVGWSAPAPPFEADDVEPLRIAAALLAACAPSAAPCGPRHASPEAVLASVALPVAAFDRDGAIIAANAAWAEAQEHHDVDSAHAPHLAEGIAAVGAGATTRVETSYRHEVRGQERWTTAIVTPLREPAGGAVVVRADTSGDALNERADRLADARFLRLADAIPAPVVVIGADGRLLYANQQWWDASGTRSVPQSGTTLWSDGLDSTARARVHAALCEGDGRRTRMRVDLRLKGIDGRYRWWTCALAPRFAADGRVEHYVGVCHDVTASRRVQAALAGLANKLITAQEIERSRIARELHDDIGQQIALLLARLEILASAQKPEEELAEARAALNRIAVAVTDLSHQLHPGKVRLLGLAKALESLCRDVERRNRIRIRFEATRVPPGLSEEFAVSIFRVAQEALRNAVRHSGATATTVSLAGAPAQVTLTVADNGRGFDPLSLGTSGLGLLTMRERVELLGGTLAVEAGRPHGTTIRVVLPLKPSAGAAPRRPAADAPRPARALAHAARRAPAARGPGGLGDERR